MEINRILEENHTKIARASEEAEELRLKYNMEQELYDNYEAKFMLLRKAEGNTKATELKILALSDEDLHQKRLNLVVMESNYRAKENEVKALDNELTSAKRLAQLKISEHQNIDWGGK